MRNIWAIGDIHGESVLLERLLGALPIERGDKLVLLGDYIDHGPDSAGVVALVLAALREREVVALWGNHEQMAARSFGIDAPGHASETAASATSGWLSQRYGAAATLASFGSMGPQRRGAARRSSCPLELRMLFGCLQLHHIDEPTGVEFVHGFVRPGISLEKLAALPSPGGVAPSGADLMLWQKPMTGDWSAAETRLVVVGHIPMRNGVPSRRGHHVMIDTGAGHGGPLTALQMPSLPVAELKRERLTAWQSLPDGTVRVLEEDPLSEVYWRNRSP